MSNGNVITHYKHLLATEHADHKKVGWGSPESQNKRFSILAQIGDLAGKSVLDVGCGVGTFLKWLDDHRVRCDYHGVDINPAMVKEARRLYPHGRFDAVDILRMAEPLPHYDYVVLSGALTFATNEQEKLVRTMLTRMLALADIGVAANFLSNRADVVEPGEYYADPGRLTDFCLSLTRRVTLRHDYMPHDVTVYLYRDTPRQ